MARATEAVIKKQMAAMGCPVPLLSQRNWGNYIKALKEAGANEKVVHCLEQIKTLHRNPLIHPDVTLTMPEALSLWAICASAIQAVVADIETRQEAPSPQIVAMLPSAEPAVG